MSIAISEITLNVPTRTEGTLYISGDKIVNIATKLTLSSGQSGYSFGLLRFDYTSNPRARAMMDCMLNDAVSHNRTTQGEADRYTDGLENKTLSNSDMSDISQKVLQPNADYIDEKALSLNDKVAGQVGMAIDATTTQWGSAGVFDATNPDYQTAVGLLASWANRTGGLKLFSPGI